MTLIPNSVLHAEKSFERDFFHVYVLHHNKRDKQLFYHKTSFVFKIRNKGDAKLESKIYKPLFDKSFYIIWIPTLLLLAVATFISASAVVALLILIATDVFTLYFLFSSLSAYAELREDTLFIKFGFILKREIPYGKIREIKKERKLISESMLSLKNALDHVTVKYNKFDNVAVSVKDNDTFISELKKRIQTNSNIPS